MITVIELWLIFNALAFLIVFRPVRGRVKPRAHAAGDVEASREATRRAGSSFT